MEDYVELYKRALILGPYADGSHELNVISANAEVSFLYARDVLKGRFKLGEISIATCRSHSYNYAVEVIKCRFELGENAISTDCNLSYNYAKLILKGRFELGEAAMLYDEEISYKYAKEVTKKRFFLAEPMFFRGTYRSQYISDWEKDFSDNDIIKYKIQLS